MPVRQIKSHARRSKHCADNALAVEGTSSLDVLGSMDGLSSVDAVEVLSASLAAEPAAESEVGPAGTKEAEAPREFMGMSPAVQGMILLNISAALFGSNQVRLAAFPLRPLGLPGCRLGAVTH